MVISLRRHCDLDSKSVVLLRLSEIGPRTNQMRKLEQSLRALSLEYYHLQAKRVKKHKKHINKNTQLALHVRHSFKVRKCSTGGMFQHCITSRLDIFTNLDDRQIKC